MRTDTLAQSDALNLLRNGAMTRGAAHWWGCYLRHTRIGGSQGQGSVNMPEYGLEIFRAASTSYPDTITPGAHQWLDRPDLFTYPSQRIVSGLAFIPFDEDQALLRVVRGLTAVDGSVLVALPEPAGALDYEDLFQHPFVHIDTDGTRVNIEAGSVLPLTDTRRPESSGLYRVGKLLENRGGVGTATGYAFTDPVNVHEYTYHGLEISPTSGGAYKALITSDTDGVVYTSVQADPSGNYTVVTIQVDEGVINALDREQPGYTPETGIAIGDVFTMTAPDFRVGVVTQVAVSATSTTFTLMPLYNHGDYVATPFAADVNPDAWAIYTTSIATVMRTLPLYSYDFTLGYTYRINDGYVAPEGSDMVFRVIEDDDTIDGVGRALTRVSRLASKTKTINFAEDATTTDGSWQRRLERHYRESKYPIDGRLDLTITPPAVAADDYPTTPGSLSGASWYFFTDLAGALPDVNDPPAAVEDVPHFRIIVEVDVASPVPAEWFTGAKEFTVTPFGNQAELDILFAWIYPLLQVQSFVAAGAKVSTPGSIFDSQLEIYVKWDESAFGPFPVIDGYNIGWLPGFPASPAVGGTTTWGFQVKGLKASGGRSLISDAYLAHGDLAQRLEQVDDAALPLIGPLTDAVSIDPLVHQADLLDHVIPPGAVILYAGGGTCPPGFKRVDGLPDTALPGIGEQSTLSLADSSITYFSARDRTLIKWVGKSFPLLDSNGAPIPIEELSLPQSKPIPGIPGTLEDVAFVPYQQLVQPGMTLRVPDFVIDSSIVTSVPLFSAKTAGNAALIIWPGRIESQRPAEPTYKRLAIELWFRVSEPVVATGAEQVSWIFRQAVKIGDEVVGWGLMYTHGSSDPNKLEWRIETNGSLGFHQGSYRTFDTVLDKSKGSGDMYHVLIEAGVPNSGTAGAPGSAIPDFQITVSNTDDYSLVSENHNFGVAQLGGDMAPGAKLAINDTPVVGPDSAGYTIYPSAITVDSFRIFELDSKELDETARLSLWNDGKGQGTVPLSLQDRLITEFRFDAGYGTAVADTAPVAWSKPAEFIQPVAWLSGHVLAVGGSDFGAMDYRAPLEDKDRSFLVTRVESVLTEGEGSYESGLPYDATLTADGNGKGFIQYPTAFKASDLMAGDTDVTPLGPGFAWQTETFSDGSVFVTPFWDANMSGGVFKTLVMNKAFSTPLPFGWQPKVGDVYFLDWYKTATPGQPLGWFLARLVKITYIGLTQSQWRYEFERYDGRAIQLSLLDFSQLHHEGVDGGALGSIRIRPAKLFGDGPQLVNTGTGEIVPQNVELHQVFYQDPANGSTKYWVARRLTTDLELEVQGWLQIPDGLEEITAEATGYLRYDDAADAMDYGAGGHTHLVNQALTATSDLVPRVNELGSLKDVPFVAVAQDHDHGYLSQYRFPLPRFRFFTACQKL